jgi:hypothetical protein
MNVRDVSSKYAQREKHFAVERLDRYDTEKGQWREVVLEDRHAGPADTAAVRIDIVDWFAELPRRTRRIAETLASGETTKSMARRFHLSPGRTGQMRRELQDGWRSFHGETATC